MTIDSQFDFTVFMAFEALIKYENKKSINIEKLKKYRKVLLEEIIDIYENHKENIYPQEIDQWVGKVIFEEINENLKIKEFLNKYSEYFFINNDDICLKNNITYYDIQDKLKDIRSNNNVPNRFDIIHYNKKIRNILNISSMENIIKDYYKIEKRLEDLYYKLYTCHDTENLRKEIKKLLLVRFTFLSQISSLPEYKADAFRISSWNCYEEEDNNFYDTYPIDLKLWNEQEEADTDNFLNNIDDRVYDITQYAIFGKKKNTLYQIKVREDLDNTFMSEFFSNKKKDIEFDPNIDYTDQIESELMYLEQIQQMYDNNPDSIVEFHDPTEEFWVLYMNYLNNLNKYIEVYGETDELMLTKKRLIYALDKPLLMLFDKDNFENELEKTKQIELDEDAFDFFIDEIYFITSEVFKVPINEYTIRKLILVGTYYNLTQDKEILDIVNNFKNHPNYDFFYDIMINNCSNNVNLTNDIKRLILKYNDENEENK